MIIKSLTKNRIKRTVAFLLAVAMIITLNSATIFAKKTSKNVVEIREPRVNATSFVVMSGSTSEIVYKQHATRKMPMGNITKLMTAMVVIDNMHDDAEYENLVQISKKVAKYGDEFKSGEGVTVEDLLKAMIVGGSNEAAEALARYSASKRSIFISEMNSKAMELGLIDTQYSNPTGNYSPNHYSTATECAVVAQAAMRYDKIKELTAMDIARVNIESKHKKGKSKSKIFTNTNTLLSSNKESQLYRYIKGGILGELKKPRRFSQYVGIATKDDMQLIVVMLEAKDKTLTKEAKELLDYGFHEVTKNTIVKADKCLGKAKVRGGAKTHVKGYTETKGFAYIPPEGSTDLVTTEVFMYDNLKAPLREGAKIGEYRIYVADELKGTVDLVTKEPVEEGWLLSNIYISNFATVAGGTIIVVLLFVILRLRAKNKRKAKIRARQRAEKVRDLAMKQEALDEDRRQRHWTYSNYYDNKDINDKL